MIKRIISVLISIIFIVGANAINANAQPVAQASHVFNPGPMSKKRMSKLARAHALLTCQGKTVYYERGQPWIFCSAVWVGTCAPDRIFYTVLGACDAHFILTKRSYRDYHQEWWATVEFHKWDGIIRRVRPTIWDHDKWSRNLQG